MTFAIRMPDFDQADLELPPRMNTGSLDWFDNAASIDSLLPPPGSTHGSASWLDGLSINDLLPPAPKPGMTSAPPGWDVGTLLMGGAGAGNANTVPGTMYNHPGATPQTFDRAVDGTAPTLSRLADLAKAIGNSSGGGGDYVTPASYLPGQGAAGLNLGTVALVGVVGALLYYTLN